MFVSNTSVVGSLRWEGLGKRREAGNLSWYAGSGWSAKLPAAPVERCETALCGYNKFYNSVKVGQVA